MFRLCISHCNIEWRLIYLSNQLLLLSKTRTHWWLEFMYIFICQIFFVIIALSLTNVFSFFFPFLQILNLDLAHEEPACFNASLNNLKSLILSGSLATWPMPPVIRLLNCSPNLEALANGNFNTKNYSIC